jgi:energy-coupling factor transporter ATP-binding protein EcfA2
LCEVRSRVGLVFQDPDDQLFCPTVYEDVAFGPEMAGVRMPALRGVVDRAISEAGVKVDTSRNPHLLSHGEKRRVCMAGVLACDPGILVLDEPTSDLDPRGRRELGALLAGMARTMIVSSHDLDFISGVCGRVLVMEGGRVVADGPAAGILSDRELLLRHGL